jgi:ADP-heptose:LPS heptosyltransferase
MNAASTSERAGANVVAIRLRQLGDVLATLDALKSLKEAEPAREVTYVVDAHFIPLLEGEPYIDRLMPSPPRVGGWRGLADFVRYVRSLRRLQPDVVLDFHSNARSALVSLLSGANTRIGYDVKVRKAVYDVVVPRSGINNGGVEHWNSAQSAHRMARHAGTVTRECASLPELVVDGAVVARGRELLLTAGVPQASIDAGSAVGLNPGRDYPAKAWPEAHFVELSRTLAARGRDVVVLWGPGEREAALRIADEAGDGVWLGPEATLSELPGLIKNLSYVVTIDSGLKHLAVCLRVPTVTIFGATSPRDWHMGGDRDGYLWRAYSCSPCRRLDCPLGAPCMTDIRPEDVLAEIDRLKLDDNGGDR